MSLSLDTGIDIRDKDGQSLTHNRFHHFKTQNPTFPGQLLREKIEEAGMEDCKALWEHHTGMIFDQTFPYQINPEACHECRVAEVHCPNSSRGGQRPCSRCKKYGFECKDYDPLTASTGPSARGTSSRGRGTGRGGRGSRGSSSSTARGSSSSAGPSGTSKRGGKTGGRGTKPQTSGTGNKRKGAPSTTPGLSSIDEGEEDDGDLGYLYGPPGPAETQVYATPTPAGTAVYGTPTPARTSGAPARVKRTNTRQHGLASIAGKCKRCRLGGVSCNGETPCNRCKEGECSYN